MDPFLSALVLGGAVAASGFLYDRWRFRHWQSVAADCSLHVVSASGLAWRLTLRAQAGPLMVGFTGSRHNMGGTQVAIVIPGPPGFSEVSIRREYQAPWKTHEIEIGSTSFDQTFYVEGPKRLVLALLDEEARRLLINANDVLTTVGSRLEITGGELLAETVDRQLPFVLPLLLRAGERLAQPVDVEQRLAQNATRDPEAGVRLKNLLLLTREFPGDEKTFEVLRTACSDRSPWVRLRAGRALGTEGRRVLLKLAESLENDAVSAEAVSILDRELPPFESKRVVLLRALRSRSLQTVQACLDALARGGDASAIHLLAEVMEQQQGEVAVFAARALETTGGPAAEGPLIRALQSNQADLRVAAAKALGRVGSTAVVLPLKEAAKRFPRDPELSQATRQAIAEIQSRLPGASPGQLSLAQAEAGQLSLATDPAGQLSISGDENQGEA